MERAEGDTSMKSNMRKEISRVQFDKFFTNCCRSENTQISE